MSIPEPEMQNYPTLSTQVIGQAENALGALLEPLLARTRTTFHQWLVLTVTAANGGDIDHDQLVARVCGARKIGSTEVEAAIAELDAAGLVEGTGRVILNDAGRDRFAAIRGALEEITSRLFDFPPEELATAGRVLVIVTERANAELAAGLRG